MSSSDQVTKIKVIGVGGGGCNAVSKMMNAQYGIGGVDFYVANTDLQVISDFDDSVRLPLGYQTCKGLGCGGNPEKGRAAAIESENEIKNILVGTDMLFICAGMGGGTGTGAAPEIARMATELDILTVAVVTKPFFWEGGKRSRSAIEGLDELKKYCDSIIVIPNDKLQANFGDVQIGQAFLETDNVLRQTIQAITDLINYKSDINLDFEDIKTVMAKKGAALIGIGQADSSASNRGAEAAKNAIECPLLEANIKGAKYAIINVTTATSTVNDIQATVEYITKAAGTDLAIFWGFINNQNLQNDEIIVTVIATGFEENNEPTLSYQPIKETFSETKTSNDEFTPSFFRNRGN